ncbi:MAG: 4Fe-4S binding protein [bacterium]|nr:4Fe-4S binding protein [bacterium]
MLRIIKMRIRQGFQTIRDIRKPVLTEKFRGLPVLDPEKCEKNCKACREVCPAKAITQKPLKLDMGKCTFCGDCQRACKEGAIRFTNNYKTAATRSDSLVIESGKQNYEEYAVKVNREIKKMFARSLKFRQVSAGGCNACEMELNACSNVNFDMARFGIEFVASPRHADGLVITGPLTENMADALKDTYSSIPEPRIIILVGACAISAGIFADSSALDRKFLDDRKPDLFIPGCPPHPLTFINGVLGLLGR